MIHSPSPGTARPFHSPAASAYRPQWMKRPYFASRNHLRRCSLTGSFADLKVCTTPSQVVQAFRPAVGDTADAGVRRSRPPTATNTTTSGTNVFFIDASARRDPERVALHATR